MAVIVGAVAAAQSTLEGHVIVLAEESCITLSVNADTLPEAAGLLNVYVTFSLNVWVKLSPLRRLIVAALLEDVTAVLSSILPLSNVTTPLLSAVTTLLASVVPSVVTSVPVSYTHLTLPTKRIV